MEILKKDGKIIFILPERVNGKNVEEIKEIIFKNIETDPDLIPEFDMENLKYISSMGLRMFLSLRKKQENRDIIMRNVNKDVYDVLEMTGFVDFYHVIKAMSVLGIDGCEKLFSSINGTFYRLKKGVMVKVFNEGIEWEEIEQEYKMTKQAMICGVPTAIPYKLVRCTLGNTEKKGLLYEEIQGQSLAVLIKDNPGRLDDYAMQLAGFMKDLHDIKIPPNTLPDIKSRYKKWLSDMRERINTENRYMLERLVDNMEDKDTFIHGNPSLRNIYLVDDGEYMVVDLSTCGYGHQVFDLQALYAELIGIELDRPGYCKENLGISVNICRKFWTEFIRSYMVNIWGHVDEKRINLLLSQNYMLRAGLLEEMTS